MGLRALLARVALLALSAILPGVATGRAQQPPPVAPTAGGPIPEEPRDNITDAQREQIMAELAANADMLRANGQLPEISPQVVSLNWPVRKAAGAPGYDVDAISNYVDQDATTGVQDFNCGTRSYDGHRGIDIFTWPFTWWMMDNNHAEAIAAAAGTIISKSDGNFDRSCALNGNQWNSIYIQHSDGSVAWYGHFKNGTVTSKTVGQTVAQGEYLGVLGSSGNSTGPHLHFELYNAANQLQEPFTGTCNALNNFSWWSAQPAYRASRVNRIATHSALPVFPACPTTETLNVNTLFAPGATVSFATYYRDQLTGHQTTYEIRRPDDALYHTWSHNSPNTYAASYWVWNWVLPVSPTGLWTFRAIYLGQTYETLFNVGVKKIRGQTTGQ